jgi:hypothetical protein
MLAVDCLCFRSHVEKEGLARAKMPGNDKIIGVAMAVDLKDAPLRLCVYVGVNSSLINDLTSFVEMLIEK